MDLSKAFDLVERVKLFTILQEKKVSPVFLRVLLLIYRNQYCDVKWNSSYSHRFPVLNGVRSGAVSSPLLFSVSLMVCWGWSGVQDLVAMLTTSSLAAWDMPMICWSCLPAGLVFKQWCKYVKHLQRIITLSSALIQIPRNQKQSVLSSPKRKLTELV